MDPHPSTENSLTLSTEILTGTEEGPDEVVFKFRFTERCRWASCSSVGEPVVVPRETEFPVERKVFSKPMCRIATPETSKTAIRRMLCEICLAPTSREYFAREISSYAQEEVEKAMREGTRRLAIVVEMVTVTTLPAEGVEKPTPAMEEEWCLFIKDAFKCTLLLLVKCW